MSALGQGRLTQGTTQGLGLELWVMAVARLIWGWHERARSRRQLAELPDAALKDLGLTRADVLYEVSQPFWRKH
ncbi:MAG: DUF1127 domain-containing protein [Geminicoccaceae bacterium]